MSSLVGRSRASVDVVARTTDRLRSRTLVSAGSRLEVTTVDRLGRGVRVVRRVRAVGSVRMVLLDIVTASELGVAVGLVLAVLDALGEMVVQSPAEVRALALRMEATQGGLGRCQSHIIVRRDHCCEIFQGDEEQTHILKASIPTEAFKLLTSAHEHRVVPALADTICRGGQSAHKSESHVKYQDGSHQGQQCPGSPERDA